jgi:hypothetical protein
MKRPQMRRIFDDWRIRHPGGSRGPVIWNLLRALDSGLRRDDGKKNRREGDFVTGN